MEEKESSGFPLDDMLDAVEAPEPADEWEQKRAKEREAGAKVLAKAILAGGVDSEESITKSIMKFQNLKQIMGGLC